MRMKLDTKIKWKKILRKEIEKNNKRIKQVKKIVIKRMTTNLIQKLNKNKILRDKLKKNHLKKHYKQNKYQSHKWRSKLI